MQFLCPFLLVLEDRVGDIMGYLLVTLGMSSFTVLQKSFFTGELPSTFFYRTALHVIFKMFCYVI